MSGGGLERAGAGRWDGLTPEEQERALQALWQALARLAGRYSGMDSTSVSQERAAALLQSMLYTIGEVSRLEGVPLGVLLRQDISEAVRRGQRMLEERRRTQRRRWAALCRRAPAVRTVFYTETLRGLGEFFRRYDTVFEAHLIPCSIDYPLLSPVPERVQGVSYIEAYLGALEVERRFLGAFPAQELEGLYAACVPAWRQAPFNLCDAGVCNAAGRALLGLGGPGLDVSPAQRRAIERGLAGMDDGARRAAILEAGARACRELGLGDAGLFDYLRPGLESLGVRAEQALRHGDLSRVFVSLAAEG